MLLSANMFEAVLKGLKTDKSQSDKRNSMRVGIRGRITLVPSTDAGYGKAIQVWCKDISSGGIGFIQAEPTLAMDQRFILELPRDKGEPLRLICAIVRRHKVEGTVILGAKFIREATEPIPELKPKAAAKPAPPKPTPPRAAPKPAPPKTEPKVKKPTSTPAPETNAKSEPPKANEDEINRIRNAVME